MKLKVTFGVLSAISLAALAPSRAEALTYYLTGTDTYNCNAGANACTINYENFGLEFSGGVWQSPPLSGQVKFSTTNLTKFFVSSVTTVQSYTDQSFGITSITGDQVIFTLRSAAGTPGEGIPIDNIILTNFGTSSSLNATNSILTGNGLALAVPFVPSLFSLLPVFSVAKRKKQRILSI